MWSARKFCDLGYSSCYEPKLVVRCGVQGSFVILDIRHVTSLADFQIRGFRPVVIAEQVGLVCGTS